MSEKKELGDIALRNGDCREVMAAMQANSVDSIVTDPPYELGFMGKAWDGSGIAYDVGLWRDALRVLKPGGHLLAFGGSRTYHRLACAIEDAGFEIRDQIMWLYGSGFPKSLDVSKAIDKAAPRVGMFHAFALHYAGRRSACGLTHNAICETGRFYANHNHGGASANWEKGHNVPTFDQWNVLQPLLGLSEEWLPLIERVEAEREVIRSRKMIQGGGTSLQLREGERREVDADITAPATEAAKQWDGWGTALKPAHEPIVVARKPLIGTVAENVLKHGTGALNIDGCRVPGEGNKTFVRHAGDRDREQYRTGTTTGAAIPIEQDRWPANVIHDGSDEVLTAFPEAKGQQGAVTGQEPSSKTNNVYGQFDGRPETAPRGDSGSAARFYYCAKASKSDREAGNTHPTVKPTALMRYLVRLITPPDGVCLDPFMGSGSTGKAALLEGFRFIGIEKEQEYYRMACTRVSPEHEHPEMILKMPEVKAEQEPDLFSFTAA